MERINQQVQAINAEMKTINVDASTLFQSISNGITHTVAVKQNGKMYSWGIGMCGQLGHGVDAFTEMQKRYLGIGGGSSGGPSAQQMEQATSLGGQAMSPSKE